MRRALLLAVLTLAACGGGGGPRDNAVEGFSQDIAAQIEGLPDTEHLIELVREDCEETDEQLALIYATAKDAGADNAYVIRRGVYWFCPDRLGDLEP